MAIKCLELLFPTQTFPTFLLLPRLSPGNCSGIFVPQILAEFVESTIPGTSSPAEGRAQTSPAAKKPQQILFKILFLISLPARRWFLKERNSRLCFPTRDWSRNLSRKFPGGEESAGKTPGMCPRSLCPFYPFSPAIPGGFLHFLLRIFRDF